jgi:hypothetical protein
LRLGNPPAYFQLRFIAEALSMSAVRARPENICSD